MSADVSETVAASSLPYYPGLEGVIAGETAVSTIDGGLQYRGYPIVELAQSATFVETAYLLLHGDLPTEEDLADFRAILIEASEVDPAVLEILRVLPLHVSAMDALRTGISALGNFDPQADEDTHEANVAKATRLLAQIPVLIAARYRLQQGLEIIPSDAEASFAGNLLRMITGEDPSPAHERALDVSLILYAEHEFNASTFAARVVTSTQSDLHSAVVAAVGALKGPLHGGANERVLEVLDEVGSPDQAEAWIRQALAKKQRIMGFGHRVYKTGDPRAVICRDYCRQLAAEAGDLRLEQMAEVLERVVQQEKGLPPNLDWPSARLYRYLGIAPDLFTPLFVASRVAGWSAHVIEQAEHNRLLRPRSRYVGVPMRHVTPIDERG